MSGEKLQQLDHSDKHRLGFGSKVGDMAHQLFHPLSRTTSSAVSGRLGQNVIAKIEWEGVAGSGACEINVNLSNLHLKKTDAVLGADIPHQGMMQLSKELEAHLANALHLPAEAIGATVMPGRPDRPRAPHTVHVTLKLTPGQALAMAAGVPPQTDPRQQKEAAIAAAVSATLDYLEPRIDAAAARSAKHDGAMRTA